MTATLFVCGGTTDPPPLVVRVDTAVPGVAHVAATGALDPLGSLTLEEALKSAQADATVVVLDLGGLTGWATDGLRALDAADDRARRAGAELILIPGPPASAGVSGPPARTGEPVRHDSR